ncbi:MAG: hypothetical protein JRI59_09060 [Deltaproteobacteria bacterium]|nr:hypothetical protein [Deltaproteobacteria bacterium]
MNILLLCEALAQKVVEQMDIPQPAEVDFASQPGFDALMDSLEVEPEEINELLEVTRQGSP